MGNKFFSVLRLALLLSLMAPGIPAQSPVQNPGTDLNTGPPDTRITRVTNRAVVGDDATLMIRVEWTTSIPRLTQVLGFTASVEVEYADGSTNSDDKTVNAAARLADLRVLNKGANTPKRFKARVETSFNSIALTPFPFAAEFDLSTANNFTSPPRRTSRELVDIRGVALKNQGCAAGKDCFTIGWAVNPQPDVSSTNQFKVEGTFTYNLQGSPPLVRTASTTVGSSAREARLVVDQGLGGRTSNIHVKVTVTAMTQASSRVSSQSAGLF
jgi:hypothetical protein